MAPSPIARPPRSSALRTVALVPLSPRTGTCYSECVRIARALATVGVNALFLPTHGLPAVPAGMDTVPGFVYPQSIVNLAEGVMSADAVILGAPVQKNAVSGWARNLVELVRLGLANKPVLPIVAAGSIRAQLAGNHFRSDLHCNFDALPLPPVIASPDVPIDDVRARIDASVTVLLSAIGVEAALTQYAS